MAIITDPDLLSRFSVIYGTQSQEISIYPVGDTQRGVNVANVWVQNSSSIIRADGSWTSDGAVAGDVTCILTGPDAGHYYVETAVDATHQRLTNIDWGFDGIPTTSLTVATQTFPSTDINTGADHIRIDGHGYAPGDAFIFDNQGGTTPTGISNVTTYYAVVDNVNVFGVATSYNNALANTRVDITAAGSGTFALHNRIIVATFTNGASASETIGANTTSGDATGDLLDGSTLQAVYSFGKEEWRTDTLITGISPYYNDDLIRHEFPFEAITSEQFEVGGGTAHDNWNWFNEYSIKKVRTGGWAEKTALSTTNDLSRQTGIVTLGSLDADTQVYYQQVSETTTPANFQFLGAINEPIEIYRDDNQDGSADFDRTTYLKLFARKKGKTYVQSEIADIGVTTIQTIVNRFPLSHADDAAIAASDGDILGSNPWRTTTLVTSGSDGAVSITGFTFTAAADTFQTDGVVSGDTLRITSGTQTGNYTIEQVTSETVLTLGTDFEFTSAGWGSSESSLTYQVKTPLVNAAKVTGNAASIIITGTNEGIRDDGTSANGVIMDTSNTIGSFAAINDYIEITGGVTDPDHIGIFKVKEVTNANQIIVDTPDSPFPTGTPDGLVEYKIWEPGMFLEYRKVATANVNTGAGLSQIQFIASDGSYGGLPSITLTGDTWSTNVAAGTILEVNGSITNDGSYTVEQRRTAAIVTLVPTDVLINQTDATPTTYVNVYEGHKRTIGDYTYAFNWKLTASGAGLGDIYQFIQHQLRQSTDIDYGNGTARGDITDLLMSFASPTGTGINTYFDDLDTNDINNVTLQDHSGVSRNFPFTAAGSLVFNDNLTTDTDAKYWLFFSNDDAGDNLGRDYGTDNALIVEDSNGIPIQGNVPQGGGNQSVPFTYDYDGNIQRGVTSAASPAPVTLVAIGLTKGQFVISTGTISRTTGITITATAALERNYLNA